MFRRIGERLLEDLGYTVFLAADGAQAVKIYRESMSELSLVVLDLVMPIMDGYQALAELRAINPKVRVLIASGSNKDGRLEALLANKRTSFIQKPFELAHFSQKVAEAIE